MEEGPELCPYETGDSADEKYNEDLPQEKKKDLKDLTILLMSSKVLQGRLNLPHTPLRQEMPSQ